MIFVEDTPGWDKLSIEEQEISRRWAYTLEDLTNVPERLILGCDEDIWWPVRNPPQPFPFKIRHYEGCSCIVKVEL